MNVHKPRSVSESTKKNVDRRFVPEVYYVDDHDDHDRGVGQKSTGEEVDDEDDDDDDGVEDNLFDDFGASASEEDEANDGEEDDSEKIEGGFSSC